MKILYATKKLEKICKDKGARKRFRADLANGVALRHNALEVADSMDDLRRIDPSGRWHELTGNRDGQWAGRLSRNYRLIIKPVRDGMEIVEVEETVKVLDIEDYH